MSFLKVLLLPFSYVYGMVMWVRNKLFDWGILRQHAFPIPVISVGNLSMGGTGKTPHVEYIIRLIKSASNPAVLSRGYKRKTTGFRKVKPDSHAEETGDEALQIRRKFSDITVAVCENRVEGIRQITKYFPDTNAVILDDAFQHRHVKAGLSILLTDFHKLYVNDYPVPSGTLREFRSGAKRADIIVVTKTSKVLSPITRRRIHSLIKPRKDQMLFFSYIKHGGFMEIPGVDFKPGKEKYNTILMVAGIANSYPLEIHLRGLCSDLFVMNFPDHHQFTEEDIDKITDTYNNFFTKSKIIVTTEKDAIRMTAPALQPKIKHLPVCYIPIEVKFHKEDRETFNKKIRVYAGTNQ